MATKVNPSPDHDDYLVRQHFRNLYVWDLGEGFVITAKNTHTGGNFVHNLAPLELWQVTYGDQATTNILVPRGETPMLPTECDMVALGVFQVLERLSGKAGSRGLYAGVPGAVAANKAVVH